MNALNGPKDPQKIYVLADHQIANRRIYREKIWAPAREMHGEVGSYANWLIVLEEIYEYDGQLYFTDGRPFRHPEIVELFPDICNRWMAYFLEADETDTAPKRYSKPMTYDRLRLIELYCRLNSVPR
jgi:hypothetical protein